MLVIQQISGPETLPLRQRVLKSFASLEECSYVEDDEPSTLHLGLFENLQLIGISTFIQEVHPQFPSSLAYRLRGMAIDSNLQNQGHGETLLSEGLKQLQKRGCDFLWFNARIKAFPFYKKLGFSEYGPLFELPRIGPHKVMYKNL